MKEQAGSKLVWMVWVGLLLAQGACGLPAVSTTSTRSSHTARSDFADETDMRVVTLDIKPAATSMALDLRIDLQDGMADWSLVDPSGEVWWEGTVQAPDELDEVRRFELAAGEWVLEIALHDATGGYVVEWNASN